MYETIIYPQPSPESRAFDHSQQQPLRWIAASNDEPDFNVTRITFKQKNSSDFFFSAWLAKMKYIRSKSAQVVYEKKQTQCNGSNKLNLP
jgi:hypothetical protein